MSEHQVSAREFFSTTLLDCLDKNFGLKDVLIYYFDTQGNFLSWTNKDGTLVNNPTHPYKAFVANDVIRHIVFQEAVKDNLTYFNVIPRLYKSTDIINRLDYKNSSYVRFIEQNFNFCYSVSMAFGINAYIQVVFFKPNEDFCKQELEQLNEIYIYIANSYKNFKKYEQAKIVTHIQNKIITLNEKAYLITDDFLHVLSCNDTALIYLKDIIGITEPINEYDKCNWLPFLFGDYKNNETTNNCITRVFKNYIFKICTYNQSYSNKIIDKYHFIMISKIQCNCDNNILTQSEYKIAQLICNGLTYKAIAKELVVSYHTVKKHVQNIYTKCGVKSRFELCKHLKKNS